jgi:hypothetical protein
VNPGQLNENLMHSLKIMQINLNGSFTVLADFPFCAFTSMGVVVGSSATFREISTGRELILLSGATNSLISFTWVCSMMGDRSVALITATLSGTSFLAPDYKNRNKTSCKTIEDHFILYKLRLLNCFEHISYPLGECR